jgi:ethanolamine permease
VVIAVITVFYQLSIPLPARGYRVAIWFAIGILYFALIGRAVSSFPGRRVRARARA